MSQLPNCLQLHLCCYDCSGLKPSIKRWLLYRQQGPHFAFLRGSNPEQVNHFSKWETWVQKDQLRGCKLDSVSSNFHKIAISYSWSKVERVSLAEKKQPMVLDTDSDVKLLNSMLLHFQDIGTWHEQIKAHSGVSPFLQITCIATEKSGVFFKKAGTFTL